MELWCSDGTEAGTKLVMDIHPGPSGSYPDLFAATNGRMLFVADDGIHGLEVWQHTKVDTIAPQVESLRFVLNAKRKKLSRFEITFNEFVPGAGEQAHYLVEQQKGRGFEKLPIAWVGYDEGSDTATLVLAKPATWKSSTRIRLSVLDDANLSDAAGNLIDGNADGKPGGDLSMLFSQAETATSEPRISPGSLVASMQEAIDEVFGSFGLLELLDQISKSQLKGRGR